MLNLASSHATLDHFHQKFLDDGFPAELSREAFAKFDAKAYAPALLENGRHDWTLIEVYAPHMTDAEREDVCGILPMIFGATERAVLPPEAREHPLSDADARARSPFGAIGDPEREALFREAIERDVLARFE